MPANFILFDNNLVIIFTVVFFSAVVWTGHIPAVHSWHLPLWPCRRPQWEMCWGRYDPAPELHEHLCAPKPPADALCRKERHGQCHYRGLWFTYLSDNAGWTTIITKNVEIYYQHLAIMLYASEQTIGHWEYREREPGGGVAHVGAVFPTWNTVIVAPTHYKQSIPVNAGNFVMQQHFNVSTEDPHTALTQATEENLVELQ